MFPLNTTSNEVKEAQTSVTATRLLHPPMILEGGKNMDLRTIIKFSLALLPVIALVSCASGSMQKNLLPLHEAALSGNITQAEELLSKGTSVNIADQNGFTALHRAAYKGNKEMISYLISKGADVNARMKSHYSDGPTPLYAALSALDIEIMRVLLEAGANVNETGDVYIRDKQQTSSARTGYIGITALHIAAGEGNIPLIQLFLEYGANVNAKDKSGSTPLHFAARRGKDEAVALLLDHGADIDAGDGVGDTPFYKAAHSCHRSTASLLLSRGAKQAEVKCHCFAMNWDLPGGNTKREIICANDLGECVRLTKGALLNTGKSFCSYLDWNKCDGCKWP